MSPKSTIALAINLAMFSSGPAAWADEPVTSLEPPPGVLAAEEDDDRALKWHESYRGFTWWEYPTAAIMAGGGVALRFLGPSPPENWQGPILFDGPLVDAIGADTPAGGSTWALISDIGFYGSMAYRLLEDTLAVGLGHDRWDISWKMFWIDIQALSIVSTSLWVGQLFIGRDRPAVTGCTTEGIPGAFCAADDPNRRRSWYGGHPATAMAMAGTTCMHHARLDIYSPIGGAIACGAAITNAVVTGIGRVGSRSHYPTDVLVGWTIGAAAGWAIPMVLHYGWGGDEGEELPIAIMPTAGPSGSGLVARGVF